MNPSDNSDGSPKNPNRLETYAGLLADVSQLITEIEADERPRSSNYIFSFEDLGEFRAEIPPIVLELLPDIQEINITLSKDSVETQFLEGTPPMISISIDFIAPTMTITASRTGEETDEPDVMMDTTQERPKSLPLDGLTNVERIPREEFNSLIMSLLYPDAERGYAMFNDADLFNPRAYEGLKDSLYLTSLGELDFKSYTFKTNEVSFSYFKHEAEPVSFTIVYQSQSSGQTITAVMNDETSFNLKFTSNELSESNPFTPGFMPKPTPYYPTAEELTYLRSIIETEIMTINPTEVRFDEEPVSLEDPASIFETTKGVTVFSKEHVARVLDELGFNPPDSGAA